MNNKMTLIEELDELHGKTTQGEWEQFMHSIVNGASLKLAAVNSTENAALIVALHNAWPQISEVLREVGALDDTPADRVCLESRGSDESWIRKEELAAILAKAGL